MDVHMDIRSVKTSIARHFIRVIAKNQGVTSFWTGSRKWEQNTSHSWEQAWNKSIPIWQCTSMQQATVDKNTDWGLTKSVTTDLAGGPQVTPGHAEPELLLRTWQVLRAGPSQECVTWPDLAGRRSQYHSSHHSLIAHWALSDNTHCALNTDRHCAVRSIGHFVGDLAQKVKKTVF